MRTEPRGDEMDMTVFGFLFVYFSFVWLFVCFSSSAVNSQKRENEVFVKLFLLF